MAVYWQQQRWRLRAISSAALCWLCALLLLLAPSLGQIHRTLHSGLSVLSALQPQQHKHLNPDGGLQRLFAAHGPTDCLLLDQGTWTGPNTALPPLPPALPTALPTPPYYSHTAATRIAAFQARAPPPCSGLA